jgi:hypothetical protein
MARRPSDRALPPPPAEGGLIVDLFAGPGGWSCGLRALGLHDIGVEWDAAACATRIAEGHLTIQGDVSKTPTAPFKGRTWMLLASPPCQSYSVAGNRKGRPTAFLDALVGRYDSEYATRLLTEIGLQRAARDAWERVWRLAADADPETWWKAPVPDAGGWTARRPARRLSEFGLAERLRLYGPEPMVEDERGVYMAEAVRWVEELHPTKVVMENVLVGPLMPCVRPIPLPLDVSAGRRGRRASSHGNLLHDFGRSAA